MNIPLERIIEGIVATMRADVIPHVSDSYARGQAVAVIDLLNNIAPRVEWAQAPLAAQLVRKQALLSQIRDIVPGVAPDLPPDGAVELPATGAVELLRQRGRLDAAIGDAVAIVWPRRREPGFDRAAELIRAHLHEEMAAEMKITRKPLFAEIASGGKAGNR